MGAGAGVCGCCSTTSCGWTVLINGHPNSNASGPYNWSDFQSTKGNWYMTVSITGLSGPNSPWSAGSQNPKLLIMKCVSTTSDGSTWNSVEATSEGITAQIILLKNYTAGEPVRLYYLDVNSSSGGYEMVNLALQNSASDNYFVTSNNGPTSICNALITMNIGDSFFIRKSSQIASMAATASTTSLPDMPFDWDKWYTPSQPCCFQCDSVSNPANQTVTLQPTGYTTFFDGWVLARNVAFDTSETWDRAGRICHPVWPFESATGKKGSLRWGSLQWPGSGLFVPSIFYSSSNIATRSCEAGPCNQNGWPCNTWNTGEYAACSYELFKATPYGPTLADVYGTGKDAFSSVSYSLERSLLGVKANYGTISFS